jgi:hypothetical protein
MTLKCLVLLSNIIKSHISKADQKRHFFNQLKSLAEDKDVIDCCFYNIFLGVVLLVRLLLKIYTNLGMQLQNLLAARPIMGCSGAAVRGF